MWVKVVLLEQLRMVGSETRGSCIEGWRPGPLWQDGISIIEEVSIRLERLSVGSMDEPSYIVSPPSPSTALMLAKKFLMLGVSPAGVSPPALPTL